MVVHATPYTNTGYLICEVYTGNRRLPLPHLKCAAPLCGDFRMKLERHFERMTPEELRTLIRTAKDEIRKIELQLQ